MAEKRRKLSQSSSARSLASSTSSASANDCQVCKKFNRNSSKINICFEVDQDLFEKVVGSNKRRKLDKKEPLENFLKAINALLNEGGGFVYVHTEKPSLLALFDEQVDFKMNSLIADDSLFQHNFYRKYHDDKHVCFIVKPYVRDHISTLCFNSKVSLNSGLIDPTPGQMRRLLKSNLESEEYVSGHMETSLIELRKGHLVHVKDSKGKVSIFNENLCVQAKQIPENIIDISDRTRFMDKLTFYIWEKSFNYITAFSKLHSGGSIYFGLSEIREEKGESQGTALQSDKNQNKRTGTFKCTGVTIRQQVQNEIKIRIESKVQEEMLFFGKSTFSNPVSVVFHAVQGGEEDLKVIEIKVKRFRGVIFNAKSGPQSFKWDRKRQECKKISPSEWNKYHESEFSPCRSTS